MDKKALEAFSRKAAKSIKTESDLDDNFGYEKHATKLSPNSRNGYSSKSILTDDGEVPIDVLCDRDANFEPKLVRKYQTRFQPKTKTEYEALLALEMFSDKWDVKYPQINRSWTAHWDNLNTLFNYPEDIRRAIYTTNAIESLNCVIRKAIKKRKLFPTDESARKVIFLAIQDASKKWTMPIRNW